jgi:Rhs element Vgr protein
MSISNPLADRRATDQVTFTLKVDGEALPGTFGVVAIDISKELNRIPAASLVLFDGDAAKQDFEISSGEFLAPGKMLEIHGGYASDEMLLFKGVITGQRIKLKRRGDSWLCIEARDPAFRLSLDPKSRYFTDLSDKDLFEELIAAYPDLTPEVDAAADPWPEIVQYRVSDWDFLVTRAERAGLYCLPDNGVCKIGKPDLKAEAALSLAYGLDIFDLDLEMDARTQYQKITASAWDPGSQEIINSEVEDAPSPPQGNLTGPRLAEVGAVKNFELRHSGALPPQELDAWAAAGMLKARFARIRGTVRFQGHGGIKPGQLVELNGLGERFNGVAFVSGVRHVLGAGDWETTVQLGLPPKWHAERFPLHAPPAAGLHPAIHGLHTGVVTQLQNDPEGEDRILVRLPLISDAAAGVWSRLASLDAGENRGACFRPEIGDEVVVGFIQDDPHEPVVLGMLHSSKKPAPLKASDDNHEKGLVSRSGIKVLFNDEAPSLTVETPQGNRIFIDDKEGLIRLSDQSGNSLLLDSEGISLESPGKIVLKAAGDLSLEGLNIALKAGAALSVEGAAGAALKSGGATEVKGAVVKIN